MSADVHPCIGNRLDSEVIAWAKTQWPSELGPALEFFRRFYHAPLAKYVPLPECDAAECASGAGLNAIAYVLSGGRSIVGYDKTESRVAFANELAERLGLADRARFEVRNIQDLPPHAVDVFFSLQTLEHVPNPLEALRAMADRTKEALVLSTPNLWWPKDGHDTGLFFGHWAPREMRKRYAELLGGRTDQFCRFLSPKEIAQTLPEFDRATRFYNFDRLEDWLDQFPVYFPYGAHGGRMLPARRHRRRWRLATAAARWVPHVARDLAPMVEGIYVARDAHPERVAPVED